MELKKSNAKHKKFAAVFQKQNGYTKTVNFGDDRYQDFTQHKDPERKKKYLRRHRNDPHNFDSAGELSRVILWSSPNLETAVKKYEKKHNIKVKLSN
jgi:hypothetical protein